MELDDDFRRSWEVRIPFLQVSPGVLAEDSSLLGWTMPPSPSVPWEEF